MQENTNKALAINSVILYVRLAITSVFGLFTTRFALQALGINDYGIFSVVGSIISFIGIINTIMVSTSNRFIATAIGKNDSNAVNETFNVNLTIYVILSVLLLLFAIPVGDWYIYHFVHYDGSIDNVVKVYNITVMGSAISFLGVPFNGLLLAKERFVVFCATDVISSIIRLIASYALIYYFVDKLFVYTWVNTFTAAYPTIVFYFYCKKQFPEILKLKFVRSKSAYKEVLSFSVWVGYGAVASVGKSQGAALIVNLFFNTIMNTALGIANSVNHILLMFSSNATKPMAPQITKSYAAGDKERSESLVCFSSKVSFLVMFFISTPFLLVPEFIYGLWLGQIPPFVIVFTYLIIIDALIGSLNAGIPELIFATGNIKWYQIIVNTFFIASVVAAYFVLKAGAPAYALIITYVVFSIIVLVIRQVVLNRVVHFNNWRLLKESYLPCGLIVLMVAPFIVFTPPLHPLLLLLLMMAYEMVVFWGVGLNTHERLFIKSLIDKNKKNELYK